MADNSGSFDDLIPSSSGTGTFDDLIPHAGAPTQRDVTGGFEFAWGAPSNPDYSASVRNTKFGYHPLPNPLPVLGGTAEGIVGGVAGLPGGFEALMRSASRLPWYLGGLGSSSPVSQQNILPMPSTVENTLFGRNPSQEVQQGRSLGELMSLPATVATTEGIGAVPGLVGKIARPVLKIPGQARGKVATAAAEALRSKAAGLGETAVMSEKMKAAASEAAIASKQAQRQKLEKQLGDIEKAQQEIEQWNEIRKRQGRDVRTAPSEAELADIRQRVSGVVLDRVLAAEKKAKDAGLNEVEATGFAADQQQKVVDAEKAADALDAEFKARPQMTAIEFGDKIQDAASKIEDESLQNRKEQSGLDEALNGSSEQPDVSTKPVQDYIEKQQVHLSSTSRAILQKYLNDMDSIVKIGDDQKVVPAVSLRKVESLRKDLSTAINTRRVTLDTGKVNASEVVHHLRNIRSMLLDYAKREYPGYITALTKFRELSRPLDIFQREGALKDVVDQDFLSDDFTMLQANVVGHVLKRANAGSPVLAKLVAENPNLVDSARLYFNNELFGGTKEPTAAVLAKFLRDNQASLNQLGLYDEFSTLKGAREAGEEAIAHAKADAKESARAATEAKKSKIEAESDIKAPEQLRTRALKREAEATKGLKTPEDMAKSAAARRKAARVRLEQAAGRTKTNIGRQDISIGKSEAQQQQIEHLAADIRDRVSELTAEGVSPKESVAKAKALISDLRDAGYLDDKDYANAFEQIQSVKNHFGDTDRARRIVKRIVWLTGIGLVIERLGAAAIRPFIP